MIKGEAIHGKYVSAIYKITNEQNGKVYIGGSSNVRDRRQQHNWEFEHGSHHVLEMQKDYNNYPESFRFDVIEYCDSKDLVELERKYIAEYDAMNPERGYNRESGGNKGKTISDETRRIWSDHRKGEGGGMYGKHLTDEQKRKLSAALKGRRLPEESIRKMAETKRGKPSHTRNKNENVENQEGKETISRALFLYVESKKRHSVLGRMEAAHERWQKREIHGRGEQIPQGCYLHRNRRTVPWSKRSWTKDGNIRNAHISSV